jgi:hypothetical protein
MTNDKMTSNGNACFPKSYFYYQKRYSMKTKNPLTYLYSNSRVQL